MITSSDHHMHELEESKKASIMNDTYVLCSAAAPLLRYIILLGHSTSPHNVPSLPPHGTNDVYLPHISPSPFC